MKKTVCLALGFAALGAAPSSTLAGPEGGAVAPTAPRLQGVSCLATDEAPCRPAGALLRGGAFVVRGASLGHVAEIEFHGGRGRADNVRVAAAKASERTVEAVVPARAQTGRLTLRDRWGNESTTGNRVKVADAPAPAPIDITPTTSRFFFDSRRKPAFTFEVPRALTVDVELGRADTGELVRTWEVDAQAGTANTVKWNGLDANGDVAEGSFSFRISGDAATAATEAPDSLDAFSYADNLFPIRGRHNLGYTDTNNFGGGRNHKGQDMFARCGTRLAAARGGRVEYAGWHSAAGNYVVIDAAETGIDYVYMHLLEVPLVRTGQRVFTGQKIGEVGETGRATGCHLHFELWSSPGWYTGGEAFDPLPSLKLWDSYS